MTPEGDLHLSGHPLRVARSMAAWHVSGDLIEMGIEVMTGRRSVPRCT